MTKLGNYAMTVDGLLVQGDVHFGGYYDQYGNPIERTPITHRYNYDSFLMLRQLPNEEATAGVYTDRLYRDYFHEIESLVLRYTGTRGQYWDKFTLDQIQNIMRDHFKRQDLLVVYVMQCCNQATGYPLWYIAIKY